MVDNTYTWEGPLTSRRASGQGRGGGGFLTRGIIRVEFLLATTCAMLYSYAWDVGESTRSASTYQAGKMRRKTTFTGGVRSRTGGPSRLTGNRPRREKIVSISMPKGRSLKYSGAYRDKRRVQTLGGWKTSLPDLIETGILTTRQGNQPGWAKGVKTMAAICTVDEAAHSILYTSKLFLITSLLLEVASRTFAKWPSLC